MSLLLSFLIAATPARGAAPKASIIEAVDEASQAYGIEPKLLLAVIEVESAFNPRARGPRGEVGLMQLHPKFHPGASFDIRGNILQGAAYLARVRAECPNKARLTWVNCYNKGTARRLRHPDLFPYYKRVMAAYHRMGGKLAFQN